MVTMRQALRRPFVWIPGVIVMSIPVLFILMGLLLSVIIVGRTLYGGFLLSRINRTALLSECREMIVNRSNYPTDDTTDPRLMPGEKILLFGAGTAHTSVPAEISRLRPEYVLIRTNELVIGLSAPRGVQIVGSAEGVQGYGSQQLTNGLWLRSGGF